MGRSDTLNNAKKNINDEFYTRMEDIEEAIPFIGEELEGKKVLLPCDHPKRSMFYRYFYNNFKKYKLKKLTTVTYEGFMCEYDGNNETIEQIDGDITHDNIDKLIKEADVIITNPPFSLFGTFFDKIKNKKFMIIGPLTSLVNTVVFELIKEGKCFTYKNVTKFKNPQGYVVNSPCVWLTNIRDKKCVKKIVIEKLDNHDYYNFNKTSEALLDHTYKNKAVPITYLLNHDPERFEIIGKTKTAKLKGKNLFTRVLIKDKSVDK